MKRSGTFTTRKFLVSLEDELPCLPSLLPYCLTRRDTEEKWLLVHEVHRWM